MREDMVFYSGEKSEKRGSNLEKLKLLIADDSDEFAGPLSELLRGAYILRRSREGLETLEVIGTFRPDILILDLMLPGLDGISVLRQTAAAGLQPMVLATSRYISDYVVDAVSQLGVGYLMRKPCDVRATVARLGDLTQRLKQPLFTQPDPRTAVSNVLLALNVPTKLRGYACLREAILERMRDPAQSVTKELYPSVASVCCGTPVQVERAIRGAIAAAWLRRDEQVWRLYFQPDADGSLARPTNAAFISRLADSIALSMEAGMPEMP